MLNKALLMPPILFKISIGNQSHCSIKLSKNFAMSGELITVTVNPDVGYDNTIVGISTNGTVTKVNNTTFTFIMPSENVIVSASSSLLSFRINVNKQGSGTVNVKSIANYGEIVTVSFYPSEDYKFGSISISGVSLSGSGNSRTFVMPAHDVTINVVFSEIYPGFTRCALTIGYKKDEQAGSGDKTEIYHMYGKFYEPGWHIGSMSPDIAIVKAYSLKVDGIRYYFYCNDNNNKIHKKIIIDGTTYTSPQSDTYIAEELFNKFKALNDKTITVYIER